MKAPLDISKPKEEFDSFLELEGNDRIIFSGIFGIGKTYFLKEHFSNHPKFLSIHLYPTNYSVSKNEDIFELIKYDILYELLRHKPQLEKLSASHLEALYFLQPHEIYGLIKHFIEVIPLVGKPTLKIIKPLEELVKALVSKKAELERDDSKNITAFADRLQVSRGSIYEKDFYTELLIKLIQNIRETTGKKIILIVDDLDRIDPEHIFRILNIFAVHFDEHLFNEDENKFDLDKVLVTCDIDNIKKIFRHRYGADVDFNGYIDKFYSREIYHFDNRQVVKKWINEFSGSLQIVGHGQSQSVILRNYREFFNLLIYSMVYSNTINLRTLKSWYGKRIILENRKCVLAEKSLHRWQMQIFEVFTVLSKMLNGPHNVLEVFKKTAFVPITSYSDNIRPLGDLVSLCDFRTHRFDSGVSYSYSSDGYIYNYTIRSGHGEVSVFDQLYFTDITQLNLAGAGQPVGRVEIAGIPFNNLINKGFENYLLGLVPRE